MATEYNPAAVQPYTAHSNRLKLAKPDGFKRDAEPEVGYTLVLQELGREKDILGRLYQEREQNIRPGQAV